MISIKVNLEPSEYAKDSYEKNNYILDTWIEIPNNSNAIDVVSAFVKAMEIETFCKETIANALYNYAIYMANNEKFELKLDEDFE